jgi:hypothetical protein
MILLGLSLSIAYLMYVFHHTYVFEEYFELLGLEKSKLNLFYFAEYKKFIERNANEGDWQMSYTGYLGHRRNNFIVRLLLCPFCVSFWLSLVGSLLIGSVFSTLVVSFLACLAYFLLHSLVKLSK